MILKQGDVFRDKYRTNLLLCTTNSVKDKNGKLVMGKGTAGIMSYYYPWCARDFGEAITTSLYGLVILHKASGFDRAMIGAFQTKYHWRDKSDLTLIKYSTLKLFEWLLANPDKAVSMPFPGVGNGGRTKEEVLPIISLLPDNVTVYEEKNGN